MVAQLEHPECAVRRQAIIALSKLEPATLANYAGAVVRRWLKARVHPEVREVALATLGQLEPETLAQHADAVVEMLKDHEFDVCWWALDTLAKLPPATLAQHGGALIDTWLEDEDYDDDDEPDPSEVRFMALGIVVGLPTVELAKHADAVVARLPELSRNQRIAAAKMLGKLEPAAAARWHDGLAAKLEEPEEWSERCEALAALANLEPATLAEYPYAINEKAARSNPAGGSLFLPVQFQIYECPNSRRFQRTKFQRLNRTWCRAMTSRSCSGG